MQKHAQAPSTGQPRLKALLSRPSRESLDWIAKTMELIADLHKIPSAHRNKLPGQVHELSKILTEERGTLARPYWSSPGLFSAYLYYFLPWNLYRLAWLLSALDLGVRSGSRILDLGSGPLTLPLALWCARPDLRSLPLHFVCTDIAMQPMESGKAILEALAGQQMPWRISLQRSPLEKALSAARTAPYSCILAGNVLNEVADERNGRSDSLEQKLDKLMNRAASAISPQGRLFLLEPGTRLGGKLISLARASALETGFSPLAPCTHGGSCPTLRKIDTDRRSHQDARYSGWCHFTFPTVNVPDELAQLSRAAKLDKQSLALSCLLLSAPDQATAEAKSGIPDYNAADSHDELAELEALYAEMMNDDNQFGTQTGRIPDRDDDSAKARSIGGSGLAEQKESVGARVISGPIRLDGIEESARYVCCEKGLGLLLHGADFLSGSLVQVTEPGTGPAVRQAGRLHGGQSPDTERSQRTPARDAKSGAIILVPATSQAPQKREPERGTAVTERNRRAKNGRERRPVPGTSRRSLKDTPRTRNDDKSRSPAIRQKRSNRKNGES